VGVKFEFSPVGTRPQALALSLSYRCVPQSCSDFSNERGLAQLYLKSVDTDCRSRIFSPS
jgi:hypothetical protein